MAPGRKPIKEGVIVEYVPSSKRSRYRYLFIFSDLVMITEAKKTKRKQDKTYKFLEEFNTISCMVAHIPDTLCKYFAFHSSP